MTIIIQDKLCPLLLRVSTLEPVPKFLIHKKAMSYSRFRKCTCKSINYRLSLIVRCPREKYPAQWRVAAGKKYTNVGIEIFLMGLRNVMWVVPNFRTKKAWLMFERVSLAIEWLFHSFSNKIWEEIDIWISFSSRKFLAQ